MLLRRARPLLFLIGQSHCDIVVNHGGSSQVLNVPFRLQHQLQAARSVWASVAFSANKTHLGWPTVVKTLFPWKRLSIVLESTMHYRITERSLLYNEVQYLEHVYFQGHKNSLKVAAKLRALLARFLPLRFRAVLWSSLYCVATEHAQRKY